MNSRLTELDRKIGARLKQMRMKRGLSQAALAEMLEITFQQIQKYENGTNRISAANMLRSCVACDVTPGEFFAGVEMPRISNRIQYA